MQLLCRRAFFAGAGSRPAVVERRTSVSRPMTILPAAGRSANDVRKIRFRTKGTKCAPDCSARGRAPGNPLTGSKVMTEETAVPRAFHSRPVVLVVEDEPLVLINAMDTLTDEGFEAIGAANADQALRILESRNDISIVFTDVNMPGSMDGLKLAQAVRGRWPPIQIIVASAFRLPGGGALPAGGRFFQKPYDALRITQAVREMTR
jgi:CheY-like chemotaxis protein